MLIIDGVDLPSPVDYSVPSEDLDSEGSGRNEEGVMQRDRIREGTRTIRFGWVMLTEEETAKLLSAAKPSKFNLTYRDPEYGIVTKSVYASKKDSKLVSNDPKDIRWNVTINFIEN